MSARDLEGKVIVVTGGSRGIGREIVLGAVARGAQVAFCGRTVGQNAQGVKEEAERRGGAGRVIAVRADVSEEDDSIEVNLFGEDYLFEIQMGVHRVETGQSGKEGAGEKDVVGLDDGAGRG